MPSEKNCPGPWRRLLVCTDGSANSQVAVDETLALARWCGSRVFALQVLEIVPEFEAIAPDLVAQLAAEMRTQMESVKTKAIARGVALQVRIKSSVSPLAAILEEIGKVQPDLVLMGRYGKTGLDRLMLGSGTARVIGVSPVMVLVVPLGATLGFSRILIASDGSPGSEAASTEALALARRTRAKLVAVSVASRKKEIGLAKQILKNLENTARKGGLKVESRVLVGEPDAAIVQASKKHQAQLIVLGNHGRTGWQRLLLGSVAERVIGQAACPVLVVKQSPPQNRSLRCLPNILLGDEV